MPEPENKPVTLRPEVVNELVKIILTATEEAAEKTNATIIEVGHAYLMAMYNSGAIRMRNLMSETAEAITALHDTMPAHEHDPSCPHHPANTDPSKHN